MSFGRLLFLFCIAAAGALLLRLCVFEGVYVATGSMEPTLPVGTHVVLDKVTLLVREPRRGEIIVFSSPIPPHQDMIKRVIGLPQETVEMREKKVFIDSKPLDEPYARHTRQEEKLKGDSFEPLTVPNLHLFVLGDNRDESNDASVWTDPKTGEPVRFLPLMRVRGLLRGFY